MFCQFISESASSPTDRRFQVANLVEPLDIQGVAPNPPDTRGISEIKSRTWWSMVNPNQSFAHSCGWWSFHRRWIPSTIFASPVARVRDLRDQGDVMPRKYHQRPCSDTGRRRINTCESLAKLAKYRPIASNTTHSIILYAMVKTYSIYIGLWSSHYHHYL